MPRNATSAAQICWCCGRRACAVPAAALSPPVSSSSLHSAAPPCPATAQRSTPRCAEAECNTRTHTHTHRSPAAAGPLLSTWWPLTRWRLWCLGRSWRGRSGSCRVSTGVQATCGPARGRAGQCCSAGMCMLGLGSPASPAFPSRGAASRIAVGAQARLMSGALRKIAGNASKHNCTIIFLNQLRQKVRRCRLAPRRCALAGCRASAAAPGGSDVWAQHSMPAPCIAGQLPRCPAAMRCPGACPCSRPPAPHPPPTTYHLPPTTTTTTHTHALTPAGPQPTPRPHVLSRLPASNPPHTHHTRPNAGGRHLRQP